MKNSMVMKFALAFSLSFAVVSFAQQGTSASDDLVKKRAELNRAKADLEEARQKRDMEVAARWNDREKANDERELFNEKYDEAKESLDRLMEERARLEESVRVGREDLAQVKAASEAKRAEYLALSLDKGILEPLQRLKDQGVPFKMPERIEGFNRVEKSMDIYKDDPVRIAKSVFTLAKQELDFTREIEWKKGEILLGTRVAYGEELRLGGVFAMRRSSGMDSSVSMMLPVSSEKGQTFAWRDMSSPESKVAVAKAFASAPDSSRVMVPVDVLLSTALSTELANAEDRSFWQTCRATFRDGGILMYPIALLLILGILLVIERVIVLSLRGSTLKYRPVIRLCEEKKLDEAKAKTKKLHGSVGRVIQAALAKDYKSRDDAEKAIEEVFTAEVPSLEKGLSSISVMATTAPLLGLLGTVMGMIQLFQVITMHGTSDPKLLAGGISVALITTEAGLIVAIPLQLLHTFLSNRVDGIRNRMEKAGLAILNALYIKD
ncbi:MAG: DUF3450 family protein [Fibrobacteraceae bacterium]|nr:DUF3450 family protein [Fibrobacteraceae bacterium]